MSSTNSNGYSLAWSSSLSKSRFLFIARFLNIGFNPSALKWYRTVHFSIPVKVLTLFIIAQIHRN